MKIDAYTRGVLTIIAACLLWMCLNESIPSVWAQAARQPPTEVVLVDAKGTPLFTSEGLRVNFGGAPVPVTVSKGSLPVDVTNPTLAVVVRAIQRSSEWDPIQVQVLREPPTLKPVP